MTPIRLPLAAAILALTAASGAQTLQSGDTTLSFPRLDSKAGIGYGLQITSAKSSAVVESLLPVQLFLCKACDDSESAKPALGFAYSEIATQKDKTFGNINILATADIDTPGGSRFHIVDAYMRADTGKHTRVQPGSFLLTRQVTVVAAGSEKGWASEFLLGFAHSRPIGQYHFLAPGVWYDDNSHATASSFATNYNNHYFFFRDTRLGLPFVMMNDPGGATLSIATVDSIPSSGVDEGSPRWIVDKSINYGSLGVQRTSGVQLGFIHPANEGEDSHVGGHKLWNHRSYPVTKDASDSFVLLIALTNESSYPIAVRDTWRRYYDDAPSDVVSLPMDTVYKDQIDLLNHYSTSKSGAQFFPFNVNLPDGSVRHNGPVNIGFTGQDTALGFNLLRYGVLHNDKKSFDNGKATLDFWADKSMRPSGLPNTGFQPDSDKWVDSDCHPTFLRALTDGLEGMLSAAIFMREHNQPQPNWEKWSNTTGNFLLTHQNPDGSFYRSFNPDGTPYTNMDKPGCNTKGFGTSKYNTTNALRSLVLLYIATGDTRYRDAALKAGNYSLDAIYKNAIFVGGTADNPNTLDKEGAVLAMRGALALYDMTHEQKWLTAARTAADFTETWSYAWTWPIRDAPPQYAHAGTRGNSLIATGHSGADISLSFDSYTYYRLHLLGDDDNDHYLRFALDIENNTKLTTQISGVPSQQFNFGVNGLAGEAVGLSDMKWVDGKADLAWLPWVSDSEIDPLQRMQDTFGVTSIEAAQKLPTADLQKRNEDIYPKPGTISWGK